MILHILKDPENRRAIEVIRQSVGNSVSLVLIQEAVRMTDPLPGTVFHLSEDAAARGVHPSSKPISYPDFLHLIFEADSVVVW
jgi:sulfur transfer complex TusBCD TusB component (DsrH family)